MKNSLLIMLVAVGLLFGQTPDQIKQAKEVVKSTGMSQAQPAAKAQVHTDQQIEAAVKKGKDSKSELEKPATESEEEVGRRCYTDDSGIFHSGK